MGHQQNEAITKKLSEFAFNFRYANLPHEVIEQAKLFILDTLGCALGGRTQAKEEVSWITMFTDTQKSKGNSTIFGEKERTSAAIAALANGAIAHTLLILMIRTCLQSPIWAHLWWQQHSLLVKN